MTIAKVKAEIRSAFDASVYPGDNSLANSREGTEPALLQQEFRRKTDWRILDPSFIDRAPDGFGTALSFFSDEAFRFYLPAYLLADLDGRLKQANVVFALTHGLDNTSRDQRINPRRYGDRTWFDHAQEKFAHFGAGEVAAIVSYLNVKLTSDDLVDFEKASIREAIENYWAGRR
jgi:uncharacterized protein DUF6714